MPTCLARGSSVGRMLPSPMLLRAGPIPTGAGWSFEVKYDGFRAIVSTENGFQVRSRRGWNMAERVPELRNLPHRVSFWTASSSRSTM